MFQKNEKDKVQVRRTQKKKKKRTFSPLSRGESNNRI